jgi:hypothetical protein
MALRDRYLKAGVGIDEAVTRRQARLRDQMSFLELDFTKLRNEFNAYLIRML